MIANGYGSYYCVDEDISYQGWYQHQTNPWRMQKIIESITPLQEGDIKEFYHQLYGLRRVFESGAQDTVILHQKTLLYTTLSIKEVLLTLDHRESYELSRLGRAYDIDIQEDFVLISFTQKNDGGIEQQHFVGIKGVRSATLVNEWKEKEYETDKRRNAQSTYWVFEAIKFVPGHKIVFSSASSKAEARTLCDIAYHHYEDIVTNVHLQSKEQLPHFNHVRQSRMHSAVSMASWSLRQLHQKFQFDHKVITGIYAGYPWFFQLWSRDELISLGGLMVLAQEQNSPELYTQIKDILARHLKSILANGTLANRYPHSDLGSIDAFGWLAKRITDFLELLKEEKKLYTLFEIPELLFWYKLLEEGLQKAKKYHQEKGLYKNGFNETWMDTSHNDDGRSGFRIEIQALYYAVYDALITLGKSVDNPQTTKLLEEQKFFKENIRKYFFINGKLIDGFNEARDEAHRPNVFLAGFVAYDLFSDEEWKKIILEHLEHLLMPWGGISTIEPTHPLFKSRYTGQTNESYHRGDSWYFINNIAAVLMHKVDSRLFKDAIDLIAQASATDILDLGWAGHGSEVSSAQEQEAHGCLAQAWSVATYLELMKQLFR